MPMLTIEELVVFRMALPHASAWLTRSGRKTSQRSRQSLS
jgi:hypothetical protein